MNAFFASVEQRDFPELRGKPIGVTNGEVGSTLITCSYEARAAGVKTGMRLREARLLCPDIIQRPARPRIYTAISTAIMHALTDISPDVEVFSVDEAFIDVTHCQRLHGTPEHMAQMVRDRVTRITHGLPCSIGVAGDKSTAKVASDLHKPNGLTVIPPWEARERLRDIPMEKICGIGPRISVFLRQYGARTCGDVAAMPVNLLIRRYGVVGKHLWLMCQGRDTAPVVQEVAPPQSLGHGKVLPPRTVSQRTVQTYLRHMCEKVAARLRRYDMQAGRLYVGLRYAQGGIHELFALPRVTADGKRFYKLARVFLDERWQGEPVTHAQITATHLLNASGQLELFSPDEVRSIQRFSAIDNINMKYGEFTVAPATLLERSTMPNVIAPAWRPDGHRQHIPD